jgi:serine/threonine protein kinase
LAQNESNSDEKNGDPALVASGKTPKISIDKVMPQGLKQFDKYTLLEPLAKGGMGEVHLARSANATGIVNFFAIKSVLPELTLSGDSAARFKDEAATGMKLKHPNIVSIFEFGEDAHEQFYVVLELIRGQTLRSMMSRLNQMDMHCPLPLAAHIIKAIAGGLNYARRCIDTSTGLALNLVHKDISPANVMIGYEGEIKIIDFGIAKSTGTAGDSNVIEGKLSFMSPEHRAGGPVDHRSDLYALGLVAYELLTGLALLGPKQRERIETVEDLKTHCDVSVEKVPFEIRPIIEKLLAVDPTARYQTGHDVVVDLGYLKFDRNDVQPETGLTDLMTGLFSEEISALNLKLIRYSNPRANAEDDLTITGGGPSFDTSGPLVIPTGDQLFAPTERRAVSIPTPTVAPQVLQKDSGGGAWLTRAALLVLALAFVLTAGAFWQLMQRPKAAASAQGATAEPPGKSAAAPLNLFVKVMSNPQGAQIFVNGETSQQRTPAFIEVPAGHAFKLKLKLEGFPDHDASFKPEEHPQYTAELRLPPTGSSTPERQ